MPVADVAPVMNDPVVAEGYAEAISNAPVEQPVAVDTDRPLRRKKT